MLTKEREIKVIYGEEIRRFTFEGESFESFQNTISDYFEFSKIDDYEIYYKDVEDDSIKISSDNEFKLGLKNQPKLKKFYIKEKKKNSIVTFTKDLEISETVKAKLEVKAMKLIKKEQNNFEKKEKKEKREKGVGGSRKFMCRFVGHKTIKDNSTLPPECPFTKVWTLRNESNEDWKDCKLILVGGDSLDGPKESSTIKQVKSGEEIDISINLTSPSKQGNYCGYWRMIDSTGRKFGQRIWVKINVE
jgi:hypothetical protein